EFHFLSRKTPRHNEKAEQHEQDVHHRRDLKPEDVWSLTLAEFHRKSPKLKLVFKRHARLLASLVVVQRDQANDMRRGDFEIGNQALHTIAEERVKAHRDDAE